MSGVIRREWESYRERCIHPEAPAEQVERMYESFYAGAAALFFAIISGVSEGPEPRPEDEALMNGIHQELNTYLEAYKVQHGIREDGR